MLKKFLFFGSGAAVGLVGGFILGAQAGWLAAGQAESRRRDEDSVSVEVPDGSTGI